MTRGFSKKEEVAYKRVRPIPFARQTGVEQFALNLPKNLEP